MAQKSSPWAKMSSKGALDTRAQQSWEEGMKSTTPTERKTMEELKGGPSEGEKKDLYESEDDLIIIRRPRRK